MNDRLFMSVLEYDCSYWAKKQRKKNFILKNTFNKMYKDDALKTIKKRPAFKIHYFN